MAFAALELLAVQQALAGKCCVLVTNQLRSTRLPLRFFNFMQYHQERQVHGDREFDGLRTCWNFRSSYGAASQHHIHDHLRERSTEPANITDLWTHKFHTKCTTAMSKYTELRNIMTLASVNSTSSILGLIPASLNDVQTPCRGRHI